MTTGLVIRLGLFALVVISPYAAAETQSPPGATDVRSPEPRKQARAVRVPPAAIHLDGRVDDAAWAEVPPITDFVQKDPVEGAPPSDRMELRFAYDDDALWVGARMWSQPGSIQDPVTRRDDTVQAEHVWVSLDTFLDRRTAYSFGVTVSGVRMDFYHPRDHEYDADSTFDPVWEARAHRLDDGWSCEMRIPFSQLRFNDRPEQVWGMNFDRWIPSRFEDVFWVPVPKKVAGWASWFGELRGIEGIPQTRRVELVPYVAGGARLTDAVPGDPFDDGEAFEGRAGLDAKMGFGPGLTLQAAVNPDFGQVEADPAEVNLSAFETFFDEKRPFFTENQQLFAARGPNYFYSRRIGARPRGVAVGDHVDYPHAATILGATRLTGRLPSGLAVGALAAVTDREDAQGFLRDDARFVRSRVAARTAYGVVRAQQQFGANASTAGFVLTGVGRPLDDADPLAALMPRTAVSGGADATLRLAGGTYEIAGHLGFSRVSGTREAILGLQRSSARYFQRPDAAHVRLDPTRTALTGWTGSLEIEKNNGKHWLWEVEAFTESPGLELNDIGSLSTADGAVLFGLLKYRETQRKGVLREWWVSVLNDNEWNFDGDRQFGSLRADAQVSFTNFWQVNLSGWMTPRAQDQRLTRGGPSMGTPRGWTVIGQVQSGFNVKNRLNARVYHGRTELGGRTTRLSGGVSLRPAPRWKLSIDPNVLLEDYPQQYVETLDGGRAETFGRRYVFGLIDRHTVLAQVRLSYVFKPDLTLEVYAEPFAASGRYEWFGELLAPRSRELRRYGTDGTTIAAQPDGSHTVTDGAATFTLRNRDFNVRSFRSNVVLRWEYRPGSTLFVVWQQNRSREETHGHGVGLGELFDSFGAPGDDMFAIKASFWLPLR